MTGQLNGEIQIGRSGGQMSYLNLNFKFYKISGQ